MELKGCKAGIEAARLGKLFMGALGDYLTFIENDNFVGPLYGRQTMGNDKRRAIGHQAIKCRLHETFALGIQ